MVESPAELGELSEEDAGRWRALALTVTCADLVGAARGAHALACRVRQGPRAVRRDDRVVSGGRPSAGREPGPHRGFDQRARATPRGRSTSLPAAEAIEAARVAKIYCARAALTVCETSIQVHGGIGNTWECLAHIYLRRVLAATEAWPAKLEELTIGLS